MTARIIQFPGQHPDKLGYRKAKRRRRVNLEDFGQMNLFSQTEEARVISLEDEVKPFDKALLLEESGDLSGALKYYEKAQKFSEHRADALCNMGIISTMLDKTHDALNYFTMALADQPRHLESHYNMANLYADLGNLRLARVHYELAIQIDPSFASSYYNLALLHMDAGDLRLAEERLMQFRSIAEENDKISASRLLKEIRHHLNIGNYDA